MVDTVTDQITKLLDVKPGIEVQECVPLNGADIHFKFIRAPFDNAPLVIRFHGAVKRDLRSLPAFQGNLKSFNSSAHQISISDPTMMAREGFSCAWYAGHEELDVQGALVQFIGSLRTALAPKRVVYLGSSAGGFAALYCSYFDPGSVALVMVPQTNLQRHFAPRAVSLYLEKCWSGRSLEEVGEVACTDVTSLYEKGFDNTVVYVQSQGDFKHSALQLTPFMSACYNTGEPEQEKLIVQSDYWGKPGHGGAVPMEGYSTWLRAAISAPSTGLEDLLETSATFRQDSAPQKTRGKSSSAHDPISAVDSSLTELVKNGLLNRFEPDAERL
ncbi:hypothetical protein [Brevibacterium sp. CFH 10365]|uniref:hypothetical protein n=1 Tax=Brevibacterium sp. CFH 10365 TaxID=2585207 RepID=UPI00126607E8|nr:hypothetical protein [Brevibacterium sp. CFH 10365]